MSDIFSRYKEKLFYEATLTSLNDQAWQARMHREPEDYYRNVQTLYFAILTRLLTKEFRNHIGELRREMKIRLREFSVPTQENSLEDLAFLEKKKKNITLYYATQMHVAIQDVLDKKNLMLKRWDVMVGSETAREGEAGK